MQRKWRKAFLREAYRSDAASFHFAASEGRGGWIEYRDSSGTYNVPYELGAGDIAFAVTPSAIVSQTAQKVSPTKQREIFGNIAEAIKAFRRDRVAEL